MNLKSIKSWAEQDRPREKLLEKGSPALTDAELIAILMGSGNRKMSAVELARHMLAAYDNNLSRLGKASIDEMCRFQGVGHAKALSIAAAMELGRRRKANRKEYPSIRRSFDAVELLEPVIGDLPHEEFWVLFLDRANKVIDKKKLSSGGTIGTVIDVKLVLKSALEKLAQGLIVMHNHPSGNKKPSQSDVNITMKLKNAAELMDISLLDHIIITGNGYYSFADESLLSDNSETI
ncbi:MAG TPA: DNA repair protein RadC [Bacteroidales bacterium]|nr:DNA repair protein RadC [Bacteroidales bacterium]